MRIGIYVDVAKDDRPTGIGKHVLALLDALSTADEENEYLLYYECGWTEPAGVFRHCPRKANFHRRPVRWRGGWAGRHPTLWWKYRLPLAVARDRIDVFHGPNHFLPRLRGTKTIVTIHDLAYFKMDGLHERGVNEALRGWTRTALDWADRVICLSENTRADVLAMGVKPERARVIYGGGHVVPEGQIEVDRIEEARRALGLPDRFVLYVGSFLPRKNLPFLLRAFAELKARCAVPHGLVLAGPRDSTGEVGAVVESLGLGADVVMTGYVEEWQLPLLYRMAEAFVLPSRYEGFTLVTIEAMHYGTPVIAADTSSIREGTADAAILVPVDDVAALAPRDGRRAARPGIAVALGGTRPGAGGDVHLGAVRTTDAGALRGSGGGHSTRGGCS